MKKLKLEELNRLSIPEYKNAEKLNVSILLDNVRSMFNVGSAFRTADAFRIEKMYLGGITGTPPHREINRSALGATESVDWEYVERSSELVAKLKSKGYSIIAFEQTTESIPLHQFVAKSGQKLCLIFGNEVSGISEDVLEYTDFAVEIPQHGTKHSLNISVCLGIACWETYKNLLLTQP